MFTTRKTIQSQYGLQRGYTLLEIITVLTIIGIFAVLSAISAKYYIQKNNAALVEKELQQISLYLAQHYSTSGSYKAFLVESKSVPAVGAPQYNITIVDSTPPYASLLSANAVGVGYIVRALSIDPENYSYLISSNGQHCRNRPASKVSYTDCGAGADTTSIW